MPPLSGYFYAPISRQLSSSANLARVKARTRFRYHVLAQPSYLHSHLWCLAAPVTSNQGALR